MANIQIPNLPAAVAVTGQEQFEAVQAGTSVRMTAGQIAGLSPGYGSRVVVVTESGGTITIDANTTDTALCSTSATGTLTIANPSGTPISAQKILFRLITTAAARTLVFGSQFKGSVDLPLPASTSNNLYDYFGFIWNATTSEWQVISRVQGYL